MEIWKGDLRLYNDRIKDRMEAAKQAYTVVLGQCSQPVRARLTVIQFPPEIDENWVRYGLAKLGQISKLPNWQKIVVLCVHNTTSALNS